MGYYVNDEKIARQFGQTLDALLADWIDVAVACYVADRLATRVVRTAGSPGRQWSRTLSLTVPVRRLDRWTGEAQGALSRLLNFLTEDAWHFDFVERSAAKRVAESQRFLFPFELGYPPRVALYSGGLDSFAGAAQALHDIEGYSYVFVSGVTNSRQQARQRAQLTQLGLRHSAQICHIRVPYGLWWARANGHHKEESSQRTRGFLFLTLGAASAFAAGSKELFLYENGLGAINLPYDGTQLGTCNSRATHPSTLLRMEGFIRILTGREFSIDNPFLFSTKAEVCGHPAVSALGALVHLTFSCDGFPVRAKNREQCGACTSCLLRRQALEAAGLSSCDQDGYKSDLLSPAFVGTRRKLDALRAMDWQAHRISVAVSRTNPWGALVGEFVELQRLQLDACRHSKTEPSDLQRRLLRLYSQYAAEWRSFSARRHCAVGKKTA